MWVLRSRSARVALGLCLVTCLACRGTHKEEQIVDNSEEFIAAVLAALDRHAEFGDAHGVTAASLRARSEVRIKLKEDLGSLDRSGVPRSLTRLVDNLIYAAQKEADLFDRRARGELADGELRWSFLLAWREREFRDVARHHPSPRGLVHVEPRPSRSDWRSGTRPVVD